MPHKVKNQRPSRGNLRSARPLRQVYFEPKVPSISRRAVTTAPRTRQQTLTQIDFVSRGQQSEDDLDYLVPESPRPRKRRRISNAEWREDYKLENPAATLKPAANLLHNEDPSLQRPFPASRCFSHTSTNVLASKVPMVAPRTPKKSCERVISSSLSPTESLISTQSHSSPKSTPRPPLGEVSHNRHDQSENTTLGSGRRIRMKRIKFEADDEDCTYSGKKRQPIPGLQLVPPRESRVADVYQEAKRAVSPNYDGQEISECRERNLFVLGTSHGRTGAALFNVTEIQDSEEELDDSPGDNVNISPAEISCSKLQTPSRSMLEARQSTEADEAAAQLRADLLRSTQPARTGSETSSHDQQSRGQESPRVLSAEGKAPSTVPRPSQATTADPTQVSQRAFSQSSPPASPTASSLSKYSSPSLYLNSEQQPPPSTGIADGTTAITGHRKESESTPWDEKPMTDSQMLPDSIMNFEIPRLQRGTQETC